MITNLSSLDPVFQRTNRLKAHRGNAKSATAYSVLDRRVRDWTRLTRIFIAVLREQDHDSISMVIPHRSR